MSLPVRSVSGGAALVYAALSEKEIDLAAGACRISESGGREILGRIPLLLGMTGFLARGLFLSSGDTRCRRAVLIEGSHARPTRHNDSQFLTPVNAASMDTFGLSVANEQDRALRK